MGYTASDAIGRIKAKGFVSTATALSDPELLEWLNDSLRSYVVPFLKTVRDEWFVSGSEDLTPDSNGRISMPNSIASTIRRISWDNNGNPVPLVRIEPENAYAYEQANGGNQPYGFMLRAYELQILPTNIGSVTVHVDFMERPADMVLDDDAGEVLSATGTGAMDCTLSSVPIAWQESAPSSLDVISTESPFSVLQSDVNVTGIAGNVVSLDDVTTAAHNALLLGNAWLADPGSSPYPNIPIEFHPLLQRAVITEIYAGTGDKRLDSSMKLQGKLEDELRRTMAPRTQGSARPIVNRNAVGMRSLGRW